MKPYFNQTNTKELRKVLAGKISSGQMDSVLERAEEILAGMKEKHKDLSAMERFHTEKKIFPYIALYQALQQVIPKEDALEALGTSSLNKAEGIGLKLKETLKSRKASVLFLNAFAVIKDLVFGDRAGFRSKQYENGKNDIRFDMLACPYHKWFSEYGCPELCQFSCRADEYVYGNLDHVVFERSQTIGTGGECCDFHVYLKKEELKPLTVHESGKENEKTIVLFHPLAVRWDIFERVIPELSKEYHLVIPAMPGFDPDQPDSDFTDVETIVSQMTQWLRENGHEKVSCLFGCSMGGSLVIRMIAEGIIQPACAVIDAGITPYELPRPLAYAIAARDWAMIEAAKMLSPKMLGSVMDTERMNEEDLSYVSDVLKHMSAKTAWNGFYSCNNYSMPEKVHQPDYPVVYWYGEKEKKARKKDLRFVKKTFPSVRFIQQPGQDHAESFTYHPEQFVKDLKEIIEEAQH